MGEPLQKITLGCSYAQIKLKVEIMSLCNFSPLIAPLAMVTVSSAILAPAWSSDLTMSLVCLTNAFSLG